MRQPQTIHKKSYKIRRYQAFKFLLFAHQIDPVNHQTAVCFTASWESHPRRVLRWLRREVSLSPVPLVAVTGGSPACRAWASIALSNKKGSLRVPASSAPGTGKVSDECLFGFQGARDHVPLLPSC